MRSWVFFSHFAQVSGPRPFFRRAAVYLLDLLECYDTSVLFSFFEVSTQEVSVHPSYIAECGVICTNCYTVKCHCLSRIGWLCDLSGRESNH